MPAHLKARAFPPGHPDGVWPHQARGRQDSPCPAPEQPEGLLLTTLRPMCRQRSRVLWPVGPMGWYKATAWAERPRGKDRMAVGLADQTAVRKPTLLAAIAGSPERSPALCGAAPRAPRWCGAPAGPSGMPHRQAAHAETPAPTVGADLVYRVQQRKSVYSQSGPELATDIMDTDGGTLPDVYFDGTARLVCAL